AGLCGAHLPELETATRDRPHPGHRVAALRRHACIAGGVLRPPRAVGGPRSTRRRAGALTPAAPLRDQRLDASIAVSRERLRFAIPAKRSAQNVRRTAPEGRAKRAIHGRYPLEAMQSPWIPAFAGMTNVKQPPG